MKNYTALLNIDHFKQIKHVISAPNGYNRIQECGNVFKDNDVWIWTATLVENEQDVNGDDVFRIGYWISTNKGIDWTFKGILDLPDEGEDPYMLRCTDGLLHIVTENKTIEKQTWIDSGHSNTETVWGISHYTCATIDGRFEKFDDGIMPYDKYVATYSPILGIDGKIKMYDTRWQTFPPYQEDIHCTINGEKTPNPVITADSLKLITCGIGTELVKINDTYLMDVTGLKGDDEWHQFMMKSDRIDGGWEKIGENFKNQYNHLVFVYLFYEDGWKALINTFKSSDIYLAEIVTNNGGNMKPIIKIENNELGLVEGVDNATMYRWQCSDSPGLWIGDTLTESETFKILPHLRVDGYKFWAYAMVNEVRTDDSVKVEYTIETIPPNPDFNKEKVLNAIGVIRTQTDIIETEINKA